MVPKWIKKREYQERCVPLVIALGILLFFPLCTAVIDLFGSVFFRRSPVLSLFGIAVLDGTGNLATRRRLLWRWTISWVPIGSALFAALMVLASEGTVNLLGTLPKASGIASAVFLLGIMIYAILNPYRSLADKIAGTWLAPK